MACDRAAHVVHLVWLPRECARIPGGRRGRFSADAWAALRRRQHVDECIQTVRGSRHGPAGQAGASGGKAQPHQRNGGNDPGSLFLRMGILRNRGFGRLLRTRPAGRVRCRPQALVGGRPCVPGLFLAFFGAATSPICALDFGAVKGPSGGCLVHDFYGVLIQLPVACLAYVAQAVSRLGVCVRPGPLERRLVAVPASGLARPRAGGGQRISRRLASPGTPA